MPINLHSWLDRSSLRPTGESRVSAVFEIGAEGSGVEGARQRARTILALDVSLSMKGAPLTQVIASVDRILDALGPDDELGVVAFAERATRVAPPVKIDAAGKRLVRSRVGRLAVLGGTNIEAGLDTSAEMLASTAVNGQPLQRAPHKLVTGDVVMVGDVELRYVEEPRKID